MLGAISSRDDYSDAACREGVGWARLSSKPLAARAWCEAFHIRCSIYIVTSELYGHILWKTFDATFTFAPPLHLVLDTKLCSTHTIDLPANLTALRFKLVWPGKLFLLSDHLHTKPSVVDDGLTGGFYSRTVTILSPLARPRSRHCLIHIDQQWYEPRDNKRHTNNKPTRVLIKTNNETFKKIST